MEPLFNLQELQTVDNLHKLPFKCQQCSITFFREAKWIKTYLRLRPYRLKFCGRKCRDLAVTRTVNLNCGQCSKPITVKAKELKKSKSGLMFCSQSCAARYNNKHKTTGTRRSKLEVWVESQIKNKHPSLDIICNSTQAISSELDFYFPSLNLAIELNGIFHYKPIYGQVKLDQIKENDSYKLQACLTKGIQLAVIDISSLIHFTPSKAQPYLDIVFRLIDEKFSVAGEN